MKEIIAGLFAAADELAWYLPSLAFIIILFSIGGLGMGWFV